MATIASLVVEFFAKDTGFTKMAKAVDDRLVSLRKHSLHASIAIAAVGTAAFYGLKKAADAAGEFDASVSALGATLNHVGVKNAREAAADFAQFANELQRTTIYSDDAALAAANLGIRLGLPASSIKEITMVAANAAPAFGSLEGAMEAIAKGNAGVAMALGRAGIKIDEVKLKAGGLNLILKTLNERFGGSAADAVQTYAGRMIVAGHAWDDLVKTVGQVITQSPLVNAFIVESTNLLYGWTDSISEAHGTMNSWVEKGFKYFIEALKILALGLAVAGFAFGKFKAIGNFVIGFLVKAFGQLIQVVANVVGSLSSVLSLGGLSETKLSQSVAETAMDIQNFADDISRVGDVFYETSQDGLDFADAVANGFDPLMDKVDAFKDKVISLSHTLKTLAPLPPPGAPIDLSVGEKAFDLRKVLTKQAVGGIDGIGGNAIGAASAATEGFTKGGPIAAAAAALLSIVMESRQFKKILEIVNGLLGNVADLLGSLFEPLVPLIKLAADNLRPMIAVLSPIVSLFGLLMPELIITTIALKLLHPVLKLLFNSIVAVAIGILKAIKKVLHAVGAKSKAVNDALALLGDMTFETAGNMGDLADATADATAALTNVPDGFKYMLERFRAMMASGSGPSSGGGHGGFGYGGPFTPSHGGGTTLANHSEAVGGGLHINGPIHVHGVTDPDDFFRKLMRIQDRRNVRNGGLVLGV